MDQSWIKKLHNGLIKCPLDEVRLWMPEILPIIFNAPIDDSDYYVDAKVHMLMPNQFPCIPNWHCDAVPRDENNTPLPHLCGEESMFLWLSGPPITEFKDGREVRPQTWVEFKQADSHRGAMSDAHQWRLFIRLMPKSLCVRPNTGPSCLRRHSQVYLDCNNFTW